ncbi:uncharacterized protein TNIN_38641 [Trichonephila inaurata madagascariensis]|uniref:Uncharacterized protein n=1 Tax=Trichonephila inaurata madagascariensis TaxID=2747483 RepID=A0A8X7CI64_9ARAC|nr:uncharacterized protein TNIN_38641 [Trichonephila inaurata madagascariensis]
MTILEEQKLTTDFEASARKFKTSEVVKYNTAGYGNCFFHAVFGDNSSDDVSMPAPLRAQLEKVFNMFLNKPGDLTGKSDKIEKLVEQTNRKIENAEDNVKSGMFSASSKNFHIILSDFKIFFATREAPIASGKRIQALPDQYKCSSAVEAYRRYYLKEKDEFARGKAEAPIG